MADVPPQVSAGPTRTQLGRAAQASPCSRRYLKPDRTHLQDLEQIQSFTITTVKLLSSSSESARQRHQMIQAIRDAKKTTVVISTADLMGTGTVMTILVGKEAILEGKKSGTMNNPHDYLKSRNSIVKILGWNEICDFCHLPSAICPATSRQHARPKSSVESAKANTPAGVARRLRPLL